jgi:hypothetical protein
MSSPLAIAAVTIAIRNLLFKEVNAEPGLAGTLVSTQPPDKARVTNPTGNLVNVFLYQTAHNAAWRNMDLPGVIRPGETGQPPLPLNLHYLITAYSDNDDDKSHRLIGKAMSTLHDHPLLDQSELKDALVEAGVQDQFERVRIIPESISIEDISKLWATFQAPYRISAAYQVSVVLIDSTRPVKAPLPVLKRGPADQGATAVASASPSLTEVRPPASQAAARLGDTLAIIGRNLDADGLKVRLTSAHLVAPIELLPLAGGSEGEITIAIPDTTTDPNAPSKWAAGVYTLACVVGGGALPTWSTNEIPFSIAPTLTSISPNPASRSKGNADITITCIPQVRAGQHVSLLIGDRQIAAKTVTTPPNPVAPSTIDFTIPDAQAGKFVLRLRVDGADSIPVVMTGTPPLPAFDTNQEVTIS